MEGALNKGRAFAHQASMTNVNSATIGFLLDEVVFGVCELESVPDDGGFDPSTCRIQYFRQRDYWLGQTPRYFFFFTGTSNSQLIHDAAVAIKAGDLTKGETLLNQEIAQNTKNANSLNAIAYFNLGVIGGLRHQKNKKTSPIHHWYDLINMLSNPPHSIQRGYLHVYYGGPKRWTLG